MSQGIPTIFQLLALIAFMSVRFSLTVLSNRSFLFLSIKLIRSKRIQHHILKVSSFFFSATFISHVSHPYFATLHMYVLISRFLILRYYLFEVSDLRFLLKEVFANDMHYCISRTLLPLDVNILHRYTISSTCTSFLLSMYTSAFIFGSLAKTKVFSFAPLILISDIVSTFHKFH